MNVQSHIGNATTIGNEVGSTCRVQAVPVNLVAHAVETYGCTSRNGELGHAALYGIAVGGSRAVALAPCAFNLSSIVADDVAALGRSTVAVYSIGEYAILAPVGVDIAAHPCAVVLECGCYLSTSSCGEHGLCQLVVIDQLVTQ